MQSAAARKKAAYNLAMSASSGQHTAGPLADFQVQESPVHQGCLPLLPLLDSKLIDQVEAMVGEAGERAHLKG